jgi:hypothetical protein
MMADSKSEFLQPSLEVATRHERPILNIADFSHAPNTSEDTEVRRSCNIHQHWIRRSSPSLKPRLYERPSAQDGSHHTRLLYYYHAQCPFGKASVPCSALQLSAWEPLCFSGLLWFVFLLCCFCCCCFLQGALEYFPALITTTNPNPIQIPSPAPTPIHVDLVWVGSPFSSIRRFPKKSGFGSGREDIGDGCMGGCGRVDMEGASLY